jgi:N-acetylmuramoyl-L-alanine amidase
MSRRPVLKRPALLSVLAVLLLTAVAAAAGGVALVCGERTLGNAEVVKQGAHTLVSAQDMASLLELGAAVKGDTLVVTAGDHRMQLVSGASAAWLDVELVPLATSCVEWNGRWFLEARSALKMFNLLLARSGRAASLSFGAEGAPPPAPAPPVEKPAPIPAPPADKPAPPVLTPAPPVTPPPPSKARPVLKGIRWGEDDGKLRAVMDCEGDGAPEVQRGAGGVKILFSAGTWPVPGVPSPYPDVSAWAMNMGDRLMLELSSSLPIHEVLSLDSPKRIVVDFRRGPDVAGKPAPAPVPKPPAIPREPPRTGKRIVVVDAGHGGKDPGAIGNGVREKNVNLSVARKLAARLRELGIDARLTRDTDVYLTLQRRTEIANNLDSDLFVSIHCNALPAGKSATGMEIYLMALPTDKDAMQLALVENRELASNGGDSAKASDERTRLLLTILGNMQQNAKISESTGFAEYLFNSGKSGGIKMRRVAQAPFYVLRGAGMPSVLVELGFVTDKAEAKLLLDEAYQKKMADALARGIQGYLKNN